MADIGSLVSDVAGLAGGSGAGSVAGGPISGLIGQITGDSGLGTAAQVAGDSAQNAASNAASTATSLISNPIQNFIQFLQVSSYAIVFILLFIVGVLGLVLPSGSQIQLPDLEGGGNGSGSSTGAVKTVESAGELA